MARSRVHDVVLFGATGFTGELCATYFARHVPLDRVNWALAGRNREKLLLLRERLARIRPACARLAIIVAASDERASLAAMAKNARVVVSTVGPFARYGEPLFQACAEHGTDYVDSTGEFSFVRAMLARHAERASSSGAIMVSCCGVDSIPTDLGLFFTMREVPSAWREQALTVEALFEVRARPSGGTWNSVLSVLGELSTAPPLTSAPKGVRPLERMRERVHRDPEFGWVVPFATIDPEIALRSAAVLPGYGSSLRYGHYLVARSLPKVLALGTGATLLTATAQLSLGRSLLGRLIPPGSGPSEAARRENWFRLRFRLRCDAGSLETEVRGGDPGYDETAKMLAESALCLAEDRARLPARAGILTPACAFGEVLLERLRRAAMIFEVVSR